MGKAMDTRKIHADMERIATDFRDLTDSATPDELPARTNGTRWTNQQLLFHMLFGFLVARALLPLVKGFGRLPAATSRVFAAVLNAATRPFHVLNYLSALPGSKVLRVTTMASLMDSTIAHLRASLEREA